MSSSLPSSLPSLSTNDSTTNDSTTNDSSPFEIERIYLISQISSQLVKINKQLELITRNIEIMGTKTKEIVAVKKEWIRALEEEDNS